MNKRPELPVYSEALLLSDNVTGSEPASCICVLAAECRSDCVRGVGLDPYACSCCDPRRDAIVDGTLVGM